MRDWGSRLAETWQKTSARLPRLHRDRLPRVEGWLGRPVFGQPLADRVAIADIRTAHDALRVTLSRNKPS